MCSPLHLRTSASSASFAQSPMTLYLDDQAVCHLNETRLPGHGQTCWVWLARSPHCSSDFWASTWIPIFSTHLDATPHRLLRYHHRSDDAWHLGISIVCSPLTTKFLWFMAAVSTTIVLHLRRDGLRRSCDCASSCSRVSWCFLPSVSLGLCRVACRIICLGAVPYDSSWYCHYHYLVDSTNQSIGALLFPHFAPFYPFVSCMLMMMLWPISRFIGLASLEICLSARISLLFRQIDVSLCPPIFVVRDQPIFLLDYRQYWLSFSCSNQPDEICQSLEASVMKIRFETFVTRKNPRAKVRVSWISFCSCLSLHLSL